jgi:hypothetical protein
LNLPNATILIGHCKKILCNFQIFFQKLLAEFRRVCYRVFQIGATMAKTNDWTALNVTEATRELVRKTAKRMAKVLKMNKVSTDQVVSACVQQWNEKADLLPDEIAARLLKPKAGRT